jgi:hypothetical protein
MTLTLTADAIINMLFLASMYILIALGFALLFSIMELRRAGQKLRPQSSNYVNARFLSVIAKIQHVLLMRDL